MAARWRIIPAGLLGGVAGNGVSGVLFSSPPVRQVLYAPALQSRLFIDVTSIRDIPLSVGGLVVLSIVHAWLFSLFSPSVPGRTWLRKGLFWGLTIWLMYWVFQEWFIYHTLLGEPWFLNLLELALLLGGSLVEGIVISWMLRDGSPVA
ncbi:MAG: hypothetical protein M0T69_12345 [Deltaproteobacteria bacterium]|nr:hypothetical protein [Deltaproteobacteria bacterium]